MRNPNNHTVLIVSLLFLIEVIKVEDELGALGETEEEVKVFLSSFDNHTAAVE